MHISINIDHCALFLIRLYFACNRQVNRILMKEDERMKNVFFKHVCKAFLETDWQGLCLNLFGGSLQDHIRHLKEMDRHA